MNKVLKAARKVCGRVSLVNAKVGVAALGLMAGAAARADGVDISAAVTSATTDIKTAGGLIIGVVVAVAAFSWIRRVIK